VCLGLDCLCLGQNYLCSNFDERPGRRLLSMPPTILSSAAHKIFILIKNLRSKVADITVRDNRLVVDRWGVSSDTDTNPGIVSHVARKNQKERGILRIQILKMAPTFGAGAENSSAGLDHNASKKNPAKPSFPKNPQDTFPKNSIQNQALNGTTSPRVRLVVVDPEMRSRSPPIS
jgi:hypothetical protein